TPKAASAGRSATPRATRAAAAEPMIIAAQAQTGCCRWVRNSEARTATVTAVDTRRGARGALMPPHSLASRATPIETSTREGQVASIITAPSTAGTSTTAEATRRARLVQSKRLERLACGKDVIGQDRAIAALAPGEHLERRLQMLRAIVRPEHVLED